MVITKRRRRKRENGDPKRGIRVPFYTSSVNGLMITNRSF
jgi:hypothetical protein